MCGFRGGWLLSRQAFLKYSLVRLPPQHIAGTSVAKEPRGSMVAVCYLLSLALFDSLLSKYCICVCFIASFLSLNSLSNEQY